MTKFNLLFTVEAEKQLRKIEKEHSLVKRYKAIIKTLGYLENNPKHPSLNTHKYSSLSGENGEEIFECYAENNTPAAYRIFWHYGPNRNFITIIAIIPHP
ncbi:MAG: hypothetical protein V4612_03500 [Pseudomonadota bacterium]